MDDVGTQLRNYYESVVDRVDVESPPVRARPVSKYSLRRRLALGVLAAIAALILFGLIPILLEPDPDVVDEPTPTTAVGPVETTVAAETETTPAPPSTVADLGRPVNPLLAPYYELDTCEGAEDFETWLWETVADSSFERSFEPVDIETLMHFIPIYRAEDPGCVLALAGYSDASTIEAGGWLLADTSGNLIARAAGFRDPNGVAPLIDDPELRALDGEYHQDWMGSGQTNTGWVADALVAVDVGLGAGTFVRTTIEIPGYVLPDPNLIEGRSDGKAGAELLSHLSMAELAPLDTNEQNLMPRFVPDGVFRCLGPFWPGTIDPAPSGGEVTTFCDSEGPVLWIGVYSDGLIYPSGFREAIEVSGMAYNVYDVGDGETFVVGPFPPYGEIAIRSPLEPAREVKAMLESIPGLDARRFNPSDGVDDYRDEFSDQWVIDRLTETGATDIEIIELATPPGQDPPEDMVLAQFHPPDDPDRTLEGSFSTYDRDEPLRGPPEASEIQTYEQVTIFVYRNGDNPARLAIAYCGGISMTIRTPSDSPVQGDSVLTTLQSLIFNIDC